MGRPRISTEPLSAAQRSARAKNKLQEAGGAKKSFHLNAVANQALQTLTTSLPHHYSEKELMEKLLEQALYEHALFCDNLGFERNRDSALFHQKPRPFKYLVLGTTEKKGRFNVFNHTENVVLHWEDWRCHTHVKPAQGAVDNAHTLVASLIEQVMWAGCKVMVVEGIDPTLEKKHSLFEKCRTLFPGMQTCDNEVNGDLLEKHLHIENKPIGAKNLLYVSFPSEEESISQQQEEVALKIVLKSMEKALSSPIDSPPTHLPGVGGFIVLRNVSVERYLIVAAQCRALGYGLLHILKPGETPTAAASANTMNKISITKEGQGKLLTGGMELLFSVS